MTMGILSRRILIRPLVALGVVGFVFTCALPALGDAGQRSDANDSPGGLDLLQVRHGHSFIYGADQHLVRHRLVTRESWDEAALADGNTHIYDLPGHRWRPTA